MLHKIILMALCISFPLNMAEARLSANPWLNPNDKENVEAVYQKEQKRNNNNNINYNSEEQTVIEEIEAPQKVQKKVSEPNNNNGFMQKVSNIFNKPTDTTVKEQPRKQKSNWLKKSFSSDKKDFSVPSANNSGFSPKASMDKFTNQLSAKITRLIQQLERTSGVNLKSSASKLK